LNIFFMSIVGKSNKMLPKFCQNLMKMKLKYVAKGFWERRDNYVILLWFERVKYII
jgi:hypothetical protein